MFNSWFKKFHSKTSYRINSYHLKRKGEDNTAIECELWKIDSHEDILIGIFNNYEDAVESMEKLIEHNKCVHYFNQDGVLINEVK